MTPGALVKEARTSAGLTQAELARRAGTTQSAIARLEAGEVSPRWDTVLSLVSAAGARLEITLDVGASRRRDEQLAAEPLSIYEETEVTGDDGVVDEHDWSLMARNLTLTYDQRLDKAIEAANFVLDGRRAMEAARRGE
jgi:transcriptional regulator with XRE-family HTH domain